MKNWVSAILALVLGLGGWPFVFSDLGPGETWVLRVVVAGGFFVIGGGVVGFFNPGGWGLSILVAWSGILMGGTILLAVSKLGSGTDGQPPYLSAGLTLMFLPILFSLLGGFVGAQLGKYFLPKQPKTSD